jgi:acyl-CoA thioester hydrolase
LKNKSNERQARILDKIKFFKAETSGKVEFYEVDSFGVVHNVRYFYWFERARTEYIQTIGIDLNTDTYISHLPLIVAHAEADYISPLRFNDEYRVLTRICKINRTSIEFENIALGADNRIIATGYAVLVYLDMKTNKPDPIPDSLKKIIKDYESFDL